MGCEKLELSGLSALGLEIRMELESQFAPLVSAHGALRGHQASKPYT